MAMLRISCRCFCARSTDSRAMVPKEGVAGWVSWFSIGGIVNLSRQEVVARPVKGRPVPGRSISCQTCILIDAVIDEGEVYGISRGRQRIGSFEGIPCTVIRNVVSLFPMKRNP